MRILKPKIINKDGSGNTRRNKAGELSTINHMCLIDLDHRIKGAGSPQAFSRGRNAPIARRGRSFPLTCTHPCAII